MLFSGRVFGFDSPSQIPSKFALYVECRMIFIIVNLPTPDNFFLCTCLLECSTESNRRSLRRDTCRGDRTQLKRSVLGTPTKFFPVYGVIKK